MSILGIIAIYFIAILLSIIIGITIEDQIKGVKMSNNPEWLKTIYIVLWCIAGIAGIIVLALLAAFILSMSGGSKNK